MMRTLKTLFLAAGLCVLSATASHAQVNFSITVAPPLLPVYEQPLCPEDGYLWTPGYWDYDDGGYYWVPGAWVQPPRIGFLWTPGYWGFDDGFYAFHRGYWGSRVGFYGGVNYGFGYGGYGYGGGRWDGDRFRYNTAVTRVNTNVVRNVYVDRSARDRVTESRASFNGRGGVNIRPTAEQRQLASGPHIPPTGAQMERRQAASRDQGSRAAVNGGRPATLAVDRGRERGVNERADRQATRVDRSERDGQLSQREARGLENRDANIERQANRERRANNRGDGLLPEERQLAERRENRAGRDVYNARQESRQTQGQERQSYEGGRRAEAQQMQREAAAQRAQAGERQARQAQAQSQRQERQERQPGRGGQQQGQGEHREKDHKHDGQDRQ